MTKPLRHPHAPLAASAPTKLGGLGDFVLGRPWKPYIVAEIGVNHEGSLGRALELITAAADAGAHCAKFQAYKADRLVHESAAPYWDVSRETANHTMADDSLTALIGAVAHGAAVVEKHYTQDRRQQGNDHWHAADEAQLRRFVEMLVRLEAMCGKDRKGPLPCEMPAREQARRSAVAARDIPAGTIITEDDVTALRPGTGVKPW